MYTTCLWCQQSLGRNDVVEAFPVGRRLAFDAAKGRLWVVCGKCERWNLTPLEERWEAIEACERFYRDTRTRASTGQIGLAKLREGLELVRIGQPLLPEFAAWRYGDQFRRRFTRHVALTGAGIVVVSAMAYGQLALGMSVLGLTNFISPMLQVVRRKKRVATLESPGGTPLKVTASSAHLARVESSGGVERLAIPTDLGQFAWSDEIAAKNEDLFGAIDRHRHGLKRTGKLDARDFTVFEGEAARRALGTLLPVVNRSGGSRNTIADSVRLLEQSATADDRAAAILQHRQSPLAPLGEMDHHRRLALEIAVHETDERRWLEGELAELEARWRDAEALAAIADRLALPEGIEGQLDRAREQANPRSSPLDSGER